MFLVLEFDSEVPIYLQIRNKIVEGIANGELTDGQKLPSVREMASGTEVNLHTVNKAYNLLKDEGFVTVDRRKGVLINVKDDQIFMGKYKEKIKEIVLEGKAKALNKEEILSLVNDALDIL